LRPQSGRAFGAFRTLAAAAFRTLAAISLAALSIRAFATATFRTWPAFLTAFKFALWPPASAAHARAAGTTESGCRLSHPLLLFGGENFFEFSVNRFLEFCKGSTLLSAELQLVHHKFRHNKSGTHHRTTAAAHLSKFASARTTRPPRKTRTTWRGAASGRFFCQLCSEFVFGDDFVFVGIGTFQQWTQARVLIFVFGDAAVLIPVDSHKTGDSTFDVTPRRPLAALPATFTTFTTFTLSGPTGSAWPTVTLRRLGCSGRGEQCQ
jgi:hypothetical protein